MNAAETDIGERPAKSAAAFRTISEVADELDVAQHVLRFWESKFPQVKPLKRGGGRRYYRPEDVDILREIQSLLYAEGYTIKGAQKLLRQRRVLPPKPAKEPEPASVVTTLTSLPADPVASEDIDLLRLREELKDIRARLDDLLHDGD